MIYMAVCLLSLPAWAGSDPLKRLIVDLSTIGGQPTVLEETDRYVRVQLTDSATIELVDTGDSLIVVQTVCAPQCSSCARVYNKEWQLVRTISPSVSSVFPLAVIDKKSGHIEWSDNDTWEY